MTRGRTPGAAIGRFVARAGAFLGIGLSIGAVVLGQSHTYAEQRSSMVEEQIRRRGIAQPEVLQAMETVPRHLFVPEAQRRDAYADHPLPIGWGQTISQPYIVALMTELLELDGTERVLEIGTGSGYQAAVLSLLADEVFSIEIIEGLGVQARSVLREQGYENVQVRVGDGYQGWPDEAPFDAIILTAAPPRIPEPLLEQLAVGGRLVAPVGGYIQDLQLVVRTEDGYRQRTVAPVVFVPMTGEVREQNPP